MIFQALKPVINRDTDSFRRQIYNDLKSRSPTIRLIENFYNHSPSWLKSILLFSYGMKSYFDAPALSEGINCVFAYQNEETRFKYLKEILSKHNITFRRVSFANALPMKLIRLIFHPADGIRMFRFLKYVSTRHDFLVSCRISSTLFYYSWFNYSLEKNLPTAVVLSSEANPYAMALLWSSKKRKIPSIYIPHGQVAPNPPGLFYDIALLDGKALKDTFEVPGPLRSKVIYKGADGEFKAMNAAIRSPSVVGIFLSIIYDTNELEKVIRDVSLNLKPGRILLRLHPNESVAHSGILARIKELPVTVTRGTPLSADINECDLVICGNSGTHLEVLRQGVPSLQVNGIDSLPHDTRKFIARGIVPYYEKIQTIALKELGSFFNKDWIERIQYYDHYYGKTRAEVNSIVMKELEVILPKAIAEKADSVRSSSGRKT